MAQLLPDHLRGNGFGVLGLVQSVGDLASSVVVGLLWAALAPAVGFGYATAWMLAAALATMVATRGRAQPTPTATPTGQ